MAPLLLLIVLLVLGALLAWRRLRQWLQLYVELSLNGTPTRPMRGLAPRVPAPPTPKQQRTLDEELKELRADGLQDQKSQKQAAWKR